MKSESDTESRLKPTGETNRQPSPQSASADLAYQAAVSTADIYRRYEAALRASDAVDFDDLILLPIRLLEEHPDVLAAVQARYRWISVDEYQDVNAAQYRLLRLLTLRLTSRLEAREGADPQDRGQVGPTSASSATPTRRSTASAGPTGAISSSSSRTTPAR